MIASFEIVVNLLSDIEVVCLVISLSGPNRYIKEDNVHIAVTFVQDVTFSCAPDTVAFGVYVPSHMSIICILYHCLIPSSEASLSAPSPMMLFRSLPTPFSLGLTTLGASRPNIEARDEPVEAEPEEEEVVVEMRLWPSIEVLSYRLELSKSR